MTQVTTDSSLDNICPAAPFAMKDSCVLKLEVRGKVSASSPIWVCLADGLTCTYTTTEQGNALQVADKAVQMAYIADVGNLNITPYIRDSQAFFDPDVGGVASCIVQANGQLGVCAYSTSDNIVRPVDVIVNEQSNPPVAYVANWGDDNSNAGYLSICAFEQQGQLAQLVNCKAFYDENIDQPNGLQLSADGKRLYITNPIINQKTIASAGDLVETQAANGALGNSIVICTVQANGNINEPCATEQTAIDYPTSVWVEDGFAYLANADSDSISICTLSTTNSIDDCVDYSDNSFAYPVDIILNTQVTPTLAYVANDDTSTISICEIDPLEGLGICTSFSDFNDNLNFDYSGLQLSPEGDWLYSTNNYSEDSVTVCAVNAAGGLEDGCGITAESEGLIVPEGRIAFTLVNSQYYAYIANERGDSVSYCQYNSLDGTLFNCTATDELFRGPLSVAIANGYLYVSNDDNTISICLINADGTITDANCQVSSGFNTIDNTNDITNMFVSSNNLVYIPNDGNNSISTCQAGFNQDTPPVWTLTSCEVWASVSPIGRPAFATFNQQSYVYMADFFGAVDRCLVDSTGLFDECVTLQDEDGFLENFDGNFYGLDFDAPKTTLYITAFDNVSEDNTVVACQLNILGDIVVCNERNNKFGFDAPADNLFTRNNNSVLYIPNVDFGEVMSCYPNLTTRDCAVLDFFYAPTSVWTTRFSK